MGEKINLQKIGLLGGSFDPIHLGHINMGLRAVQDFGLDKVFYITAKNSPFKISKSVLNPEKRHEFVEHALEEHSSLEASRIELDRAEEVSYSYKTVQEFKSLYPNAELFWLMGRDAFSKLGSWKNYQWLTENISFIVFSRDELKSIETKLGVKAFYVNDFDFPVSSSEIKNSKLDLINKLPKSIIKDYQALIN